MMTTIKNKMHSFTEYGLLLRRTTKYCFVGVVALFACYLYVVGAITFSVIERKGLEESTKVLASDISMQELGYLKAEKTLTKETAYLSGFVKPMSITFTTQKRAVAWNAGR
jgi:hypothetical protein